MQLHCILKLGVRRRFGVCLTPVGLDDVVLMLTDLSPFAVVFDMPGGDGMGIPQILGAPALF
jgi:hypothetical protein